MSEKFISLKLLMLLYNLLSPIIYNKQRKTFGKGREFSFDTWGKDYRITAFLSRRSWNY